MCRVGNCGRVVAETNVVVVGVDEVIKGNCDHPLAQHVTRRSVFNQCSAAAQYQVNRNIQTQLSQIWTVTLLVKENVYALRHLEERIIYLPKVAVCQKLVSREVSSMQDSRDRDTCSLGILKGGDW